MTARRFAPHTVTFDCWQTLIYEEGPLASAPTPHGGRVGMIAQHTGASPEAIAAAFAEGWLEHQRAWHRREIFGSPEMTAHVLQAIGAKLSTERQLRLVTELEDEVLSHRVCAIDGARELLESLRAAGVRTALICDTGFSPGRVVRMLLARVGLLDLLEVHVFSDEVRVPKPHPRAFLAALEGLNVPARGAVHVGDLKRSDIAGARAVGMQTVRFAGRNDDADDKPASAGLIDCAAAGCEPVCARPEADAVVASYRELTEHLTARD